MNGHVEEEEYILLSYRFVDEQIAGLLEPRDRLLAMMDLGATVCTARSPRCDACPLARWCLSRRSFARPARRVAEPRAGYRAQPAYAGSRRYYRGRIVQLLRELPPGRSLSPAQLFDRLPNRDGLQPDGLDALVASLHSGRARLP